MKIYLCYAERENESRIVMTVFTSREKAEQYCKEWENERVHYYYLEQILDEFAHWYK